MADTDVPDFMSLIDRATPGRDVNEGSLSGLIARLNSSARTLDDELARLHTALEPVMLSGYFDNAMVQAKDSSMKHEPTPTPTSQLAAQVRVLCENIEVSTHHVREMHQALHIQ